MRFKNTHVCASRSSSSKTDLAAFCTQLEQVKTAASLREKELEERYNELMQRSMAARLFNAKQTGGMKAGLGDASQRLANH